MRTHHVAGGSRAFFERAGSCHRRFDPSADGLDLPDEHELEPSTAEFEASDRFGDVQDHRFPVEIAYSADAYTELQRTYSSVIALPPDRREGLLSCLHDLVEAEGGRIVKRYVFELVLARRR